MSNNTRGGQPDDIDDHFLYHSIDRRQITSHFGFLFFFDPKIGLYVFDDSSGVCRSELFYSREHTNDSNATPTTLGWIHGFKRVI